jgi:NitT/TauT family transport system substrate-binding protein
MRTTPKLRYDSPTSGRYRPRIIAAGAAAAAVALLLTTAGCGSHGSDAANGTITVATSSDGLGFLPIYVGIDKGMYKAAGLDVKATSVKGGSAGVAALTGGSAQFYAGLPESQITAAAAGSTSVIVSALTDSNDYSIVASPKITSLKQLNGKKFAMLSEGNGTDVQPRWLLDETGVGSKNVTFVAAGSVPDRLSALKAHQVDATILNTPYEFQAKKAGFNVIAKLAEHVEDYPAQIIMSNPKILKQRPADVKAFLKVTLKASRYIYDHPEAVVPIAVKHTGLDESLVRDGLRQFVETKHYSTTGQVSTAGLDWAMGVLSKYSDQDVPSSPDKLVDLSYLPGGKR